MRLLSVPNFAWSRDEKISIFVVYDSLVHQHVVDMHTERQCTPKIIMNDTIDLFF